MLGRAIRRWAAGAPFLMAAICGAIDTAGAQQAALVYEKELDLALNPIPGGPMPSAAALEPRRADIDPNLHAQVLSLPALVPNFEIGGEWKPRIIQGKPAPAGKWKSTVHFVSVSTGEDGKEREGLCAGTLIDERWILTAAHCVFHPEVGGVKTLKWVAAFANDLRLAKGTVLRVKAVFVNREYDYRWFFNDIALLELETATSFPRQKLTAGAGKSKFLAAGTMATVVGWGRTKPGAPVPGDISKVLLEVGIPIIDKSACERIRKFHPLFRERPPTTDAEFCTGFGQTDKPSPCHGDSGGPVFVTGAGGEPLQAGIVSHGPPECSGTFGAYAAVGHFEPWIRQRVPNATFAMPPGGASPSPAPQPEALVYEKKLDLSLNPIPGGAVPNAADAALRRADADPDFYAQPLGLPALVPSYGADGVRKERIIQGKPAPAGKWKSTVHFVTGFTGEQSFCGGSLIDERWVLTAAHCVFENKRGGLKGLQWVTVFANDVRVAKGTALRVKAVLVNRAYNEQWVHNDIALLELEKGIDLPRQKLGAGAGRSTFLAPDRRATIVGWGMTKPWWQPGAKPGEISPVLLEASIPMMDRDICETIKKGGPWFGQRPPSEAEFCAGYGKLDQPFVCSGDSGGPIFVAGAAGEHIQVGIASHVADVGCPSIYAVFADVGHFEPWIRQRVPNVAFAMPPGDGPASPVQRALQQIAGAVPGGPPSPHGQCSVDIRADGAAANRIRVGAQLTVRVSAGVGGQLAVFQRTENRMVQLFPNRLGGRSRLDPVAATSVRPGDTVAIPAPTDGVSLTVSPPQGRYEIVAVVVPEAVDLAGIVRRYEDMRPIPGYEAVLARIAADTQQAAAGAPDAPRTVCTRQFVVAE
jgi:secreted trypsin-like serine protease